MLDVVTESIREAPIIDSSNNSGKEKDVYSWFGA